MLTATPGRWPDRRLTPWVQRRHRRHGNHEVRPDIHQHPGCHHAGTGHQHESDHGSHDYLAPSGDDHDPAGQPTTTAAAG
jgi:hypothetical protein